ncbi:MAG: alpha/beta hydrolase [Bacteroidetes bacterium]|nr:alpha/beta hydrolase [Bacteroidota bacterium]
MTKRQMKIIKWTFSSIGILLVAMLTFLFISFRTMGQSGESNFKELQDAGLEPVYETVLYDSSLIQTIRIGDISRPKILFVHGSPGDWTAFQSVYLDSSINSKYCMIAFDRPGYGGTEMSAEPVLAIQANVAKRVIDAYAPNEKFIVVCHSYGGGVVSQMLVDCPDRISHAVLAAPALSPSHQEPRWYNKVAKWRIVNWFIGDDMRASNAEMLGLAPSLRLIEPKLDSIKVPMVFIHGEKDILVPYETVQYWKDHVDDQYVEYVLGDDFGHFFLFSDPEMIVNGILR